MRKPRIRIIAVDFDDVGHLYRCRGSGVSAYGETPDEAFEAWRDTLHLSSTVRWVAWHMRWMLGHFLLMGDMKPEKGGLQ